MVMSKEQRIARARAAAFAMHAQGKTNSGPATAASMARFENQVDPDGVLSPEDRARRAGWAKKAWFSRLQYLAAKSRRLKREHQDLLKARAKFEAEMASDVTDDELDLMAAGMEYLEDQLAGFKRES